MSRTRNARIVAALMAFALVVAACGDKRGSDAGSDTPTTVAGGTTTPAQGALDLSKCSPSGQDSTGVDGDTITFGSSYPQSGIYAPFADVANGAQAYAKYINETKGGVTIAGKKYKIAFKDADDAYTAAQTLTNVQKFVNDDKVFGVFNVIGTANNIAIRDFLGAQCIPNLYAGTGSPAWGNPKYPWMIGSTLSPYSDEVKAFVDYLKANKPKAKVAILYATDDFGQAYEKTFKQLIKGTTITVAKEATYNPEDNKVDSQVASLAATKADAFLMGATLLACPAALKQVKASGWNTIVYGSATCAAKTLIGLAGPAADKLLSTTNIKDPANPKYASDPAMKLYMANLKKYSANKDIDATNGIVAYGWTQGALLVHTLEQATAATRSAVMESALNLKDVKGIGLLLDSSQLSSSPTDKFLGETFQLVQYDAAKGYFNDVGPATDFEGKTKDFTPDAVING